MIGLIYLPHPYLINPEAQTPLGLLYLASVLEQNNIPVQIFNFSSLTNQSAIEQLTECDLFGITVTSLELFQANEFSKLIKNKFPKSKIIVGGPGTLCPEYIDFSVIDSMLKGEGEITILKIWDDVKNGKLNQVYFGEIVQDLNTLPFPARHLLNKQGGKIFANGKTYDKTFSMEYKKNGSTSIVTARGCPGNCAFCSSKILNKKIRFRSPENIYMELKHILDTYKIKQIRISDETFTSNKKRVLEICELIKPLGLVWRISTRVKPLDKETLVAMKKAGCVEISFGIESFDDDVLAMLNKRTTSEDNIRALNLTREVGITTRALFMIRTPGQTADTVKKNIEVLKKVPYDLIALTSFVPLPATDIWNNPDKYNIEILNRDLKDYNFYFFGSEGRNELKDIIKIKNRSLKEFNDESEYFRQWIENEGRINHG
jgi:anaerobic magnesium-protoporphyrin IX monomethyl ester cyclase